MSSKFEAVIDKCVKQMQEQKIRVDRPLLEAVAKSLGPSLYKKDAALVATAQKGEMATIRKNFLIKKLGCEDGPKLDKAMDRATDRIGRSRRNKLRPVYYYLLVKELKKSDVFV